MTEERNKPLGPRSLIASVLLRTPGSSMPAARLVQWCELFGVSGGTARVALSRMVERGELRVQDGRYELAGRVGGRREAQDWSIQPKLRPWNGDWRLAVVTSTARAAGERTALREAMRRLRMVELREGVWARPDNLPRQAASEETWAVADAQCEWWTGRPDNEDLALERFNARAWSREAERHRARLERATAQLPNALADAFHVGAAGLAHIRADPFLPAALGSSHEASGGLRRAYQAYERAFSSALRAWFRSHA